MIWNQPKTGWRKNKPELREELSEFLFSEHADQEPKERPCPVVTTAISITMRGVYEMDQSLPRTWLFQGRLTKGKNKILLGTIVSDEQAKIPRRI